MDIKIDQYLSGEQDVLKNTTRERPITGLIKGIELRKKEELPFDSKKDRYEFLLMIKGVEFTWTVNKTSLRNMASKWGIKSENWIGKELVLWITEQQVGKQMRKVVWGAPKGGSLEPETNLEQEDAEPDMESVPYQH